MQFYEMSRLDSGRVTNQRARPNYDEVDQNHVAVKSRVHREGKVKGLVMCEQGVHTCGWHKGQWSGAMMDAMVMA